ncbi:hypothetical protein CEE36_01460 [candidate division TA06 bacterium B3_TA06]|uniref:Secretion system C-terminal sorting domain-containing protein n=1 Tax=candidate division TA06 bacterium B3_TA06 TaxID=2012487 RepID=A0A532VBT6_UNCT6|nr:MAG: hypothetical protein CEE36_01460 [candidate division TA06 bacterium B3_TA06]
MLKKLIVLTGVFAVAAFAVLGPIPVPEGVELQACPLVPLRDGPITPVLSSTAMPFVEGDQGGVTTYDYQQNGAMGNRIAVDADGNAQICWMHSEDETFVERDIYYNVWKVETGSFPDYWPDGVKASGEPRAGYTTMGVLPDGEAVIAFHHSPDGVTHQSAVVVDADPGLGAFSSPVDVDLITVPEQPIWPHIVVSNDGIIHVTAHISPADPYHPPDNVHYLYYSRSTDGGQTFSPWQVITQNSASDAAMAVSADGKVAIAWVSGLPFKGRTDLHRAAIGHVYYVESTNNGASWSAPVKVTDGLYEDEAPDSRDTVLLAAITRSIDCAYDGAGNLHIGFGEGWRSHWIEGDTAVWIGSNVRVYMRMAHWSEAHKEVTIASSPCSMLVPRDPDGDTIHFLWEGHFWGIAQFADYFYPGLGCWNPQLAAIGSGDDMVFTWTGQWDSLDLSGGLTINADIYAAISTDGGATWGPVADWTEQDLRERGNVFAFITNLTNTPSPGARPGDCESEEYHSAYPWIGSDSILHVTYIHDLFSGSVVQSGPAYGVALKNPVMYLGSNDPAMKVYVGDGPDTIISHVKEDPNPNNVPVVEVVGQHPISGSVVFSVSAPGTHASLKIYDVAGKLVETLFDGRLDDTRMLTWDASAVAAGVYFYYFVTPAHTASGRVVVVH